MITAIIISLISVIAIFVAVSSYNSLINLKEQTNNSWKQIDVQLKRRHDLIPNLVEAVRGNMQFERKTLEAVLAARNKAVSVCTGAGPGNVAEIAAAEGALNAALSRFSAIFEAYPELKATGNVAQFQEELTSTENRVGFARQAYNDTATCYNVAQQQFPNILFAGLAKAAPATLWEISEHADREVPKVNLSFK
ncbi:LemA family protein [Geomonas terrae]|uniref:LemA family protein n=1 Tax=Geomonas terrae TaxID=2562681 RepID=A0A4S1CCH5_9BACT|nr:LemA family protein [Geomonas terrae]TGU70720.1 LemA family protein [Geomonas terrae]